MHPRTPLVTDRVIDVVMNQFNLRIRPAESVELSSFGIDSLDLFELSMALEEEFGVEIGDDQAAALKTVGGAVALVENLLAADRMERVS